MTTTELEALGFRLINQNAQIQQSLQAIQQELIRRESLPETKPKNK